MPLNIQHLSTVRDLQLTAPVRGKAAFRFSAPKLFDLHVGFIRRREQVIDQSRPTSWREIPSRFENLADTLLIASCLGLTCAGRLRIQSNDLQRLDATVVVDKAMKLSG